LKGKYQQVPRPNRDGALVKTFSGTVHTVTQRALPSQPPVQQKDDIKNDDVKYVVTTIAGTTRIG
jgi:hypothetical protein